MPISIVSVALQALQHYGKDVCTKDIRNISADLYKQLPKKKIDSILEYCDTLIKTQNPLLKIIAYDWAFRVRDQYTLAVFSYFEQWVLNSLTGWGDCDDFCTHAMGALVAQYPQLFFPLLSWAQHDSFCVRRASAVSLIYPIRKDCYDLLDPLAIADELLYDPHHLVLKGYGWMLKVFSQKQPSVVFSYLLQHQKTMPRIAFRYALEKLSEGQKKILMNR